MLRDSISLRICRDSHDVAVAVILWSQPNSSEKLEVKLKINKFFLTSFRIFHYR